MRERMGVLLDSGRSQVDLATTAGLSKAQVSQLKGTPPTGGILVLIKFAILEKCSPGKLLDDALAWWEERGRAQSLDGDNRTKPMGRVRPSAADGRDRTAPNAVRGRVDDARPARTQITDAESKAFAEKQKKRFKPGDPPSGGRTKARGD